MWNLNRQTLSLDEINTATNAAIDNSRLTKVEAPRLCWAPRWSATIACAKFNTNGGAAPMSPPVFRIFDRGHFFESYIREQLIEARFVFDQDPNNWVTPLATAIFRATPTG